jgi:hypothetical protein
MKHTSAFPLHIWFAQHAWPAAPHAPHVLLFAQPSPMLHMSFAQHGWPMPPH